MVKVAANLLQCLPESLLI